MKYKIKSFLENLNSKNNSSSQSIPLKYTTLPKKIIDWNNNEVFELEKLTSLSLGKWII